MKKIYLSAILLSILPLFAFAQDKAYPFLKGGINMKNYKACVNLVNKCPMDGKFRDEACVTETLKEKQVCGQFNSLLSTMEMSSDMVKIEQQGKLALVWTHFLADGQDWYHLITPAGKLIDTQVDPRDLDDSISDKYEKAAFLVMNWGKPTFQTNKDGSQTVTVLLKITDSCVACPVIGWAKVNFDFDNKGSLQKTRLISFSKTKAKS